MIRLVIVMQIICIWVLFVVAGYGGVVHGSENDGAILIGNKYKKIYEDSFLKLIYPANWEVKQGQNVNAIFLAPLKNELTPRPNCILGSQTAAGIGFDQVVDAFMARFLKVPKPDLTTHTVNGTAMGRITGKDAEMVSMAEQIDTSDLSLQLYVSIQFAYEKDTILYLACTGVSPQTRNKIFNSMEVFQ